MPDLASLCVFCGSNAGADPAYVEAAEAVGQGLARRGIRVVYGGGNVGMMGALADAARSAGGEVIGVMPRQMLEREIGHTGIDDLRVVGSMHERKALMVELAEAFIALPGGIGTLEELFEVYTWAQLGLHAKPLGLLDVAGYFEPLAAMLDHAVAERFLRPETRAMLAVAHDLDSLLAAFQGWRPAAMHKWLDLDRDVTAVFDGHNDALGKLQKAGDPPECFVTGLPDRHVDLPRARTGGLAGGLFAVNPPSPDGELTAGERFWEMSYAEPVEHEAAAAFALGAIGRAHALAAASDGAIAIVTDVAGLDRCRADGTLAMVLHLEGAEPVDPGLAALDAWYAAGVRSLGAVWSRASAFGHGVPFRFPASPDTGPGLTDPGRALVRRCAELGILVDLSHLNAAGFADVERLDVAPIVASHCACHALCPASRNLTDEQLRAIGASDGLVGIVFAAPFLRADGHDDADMPLATLVAHVRHAVDVAGIDHVALGSDFDGATMPAEIGDVAGLPRLLDALRDDGFSAGEIDRIAWRNWRRTLERAWR